MTWHLRRKGRDCGQYTDAQLRGLVSSGKLLPSDLLWKSGMSQWVMAANLPGLVLPPAIPNKTAFMIPVSPGVASAAEPSLAPLSAFDFARPSTKRVASKNARRTKKTNAAKRVFSGVIAALMCIVVMAVLALRLSVHDPAKPLRASLAEKLVKAANQRGNDFIIAPECSGVTTEAAEVLSRFEGRLWLDNVKTLSVEAAAKLAEHEGEVSLDGLGTLSAAVAERLAACRGELSLDGLKTLSPSAAMALSRIQHKLTLGGVTTLTPELAGSLATFDKDVWLNGVSDLSEAAARAFADGKGEGTLWLVELDRMSANAQQIVQENCARVVLSGKGGVEPALYGAATRRRVAERTKPDLEVGRASTQERESSLATAAVIPKALEGLSHASGLTLPVLPDKERQRHVGAVRLDEISDDRTSYLGQVVHTKMWIDPVFISRSAEHRLSAERSFSGFCLTVQDGTRPAASADSVGNYISLMFSELNVVIVNKKMARGLKDALGRRKVNFDALVSVQKIETLQGREYILAVIHRLETTLSDGERIGIDERDF